MKTNHSFNILVAIELDDVYKAIILESIAYWVQHNAANNKNFFDNGYWTYNTIDAFTKLFPYMTRDMIRRRMDWLIENGYVLKGNYNEHRYDRTSWYTITQKAVALFANCYAQYYQNHLANLPIAIGEDAEPIPLTYHIHTNTYQDNNIYNEPAYFVFDWLKEVEGEERAKSSNLNR